MILRPFFSYYGSKWRTAPNYPTPIWNTIIEPFAGSAGYSLRYPSCRVQLYDADEKIIAVWNYLIKGNPSEILRLPLTFDEVDDLFIPQEAKWLIGFWLNHGTTSPRRSPSKWMREGKHTTSFWGEAIRYRIAEQMPAIEHWMASHQDYSDVTGPTIGPATWFIDPPYHHQSGKLYVQSVEDFAALGNWCRSRYGQVIVCEREGATWLPFEPVPWVTKSMEGRNGKARSPEVMWTTPVAATA